MGTAPPASARFRDGIAGAFAHPTVAHRWRWLSDGQYQHVSAIVAEIGRLLGGWMRQEQAAQARAAPQK